MSILPVLNDSTYIIDSELGSGGGGVVYKAWHTRLQKYVVIKELKHGSTNAAETQRNEVEALKNVKNAYLPQVFDFLSDNGRVFTVMEYIEGESLDKLLEQGHEFTQPQVIKWFSQILSALMEIHSRDICHRDIKPANIMITPNGDVCLIDFNTALVSGNDVQIISRSLGYASPEQYEIYERFNNARRAPVGFDESYAETQVSDMAETVMISTEYLDILHGGDGGAELPTGYASSNNNELNIPQTTSDINWKRSDIYSLGATMYHLLTGIHPPARAEEITPISQIGKFSEGIVHIIEQSMRIEPSDRFATIEDLSAAVRDIYTYDKRWQLLRIYKIVASIVLPVLFAAFAAASLFGYSLMKQEKESLFLTKIHEIENSADAIAAYDDAIAMYGNRIEPYKAMAKRLWDEGDFYGCQKFIEENLVSIAKYQDIEENWRELGDIYYTLGNCYFFQSGAPDYYQAIKNFEIAMMFVKDNPAYYSDYAMSLARTGDISGAEQSLMTAKTLSIDEDSLNLLNGEISFSKSDYDSAIDSFSKVISQSNKDDLRYRAYRATDEIFKLTGYPEKSVDLLLGATNRIPLNRVSEILERLADAYIKCDNYKDAIAVYEKLLESGVPRFNIMYNLAILFQRDNELDRSSDLLVQMKDMFPNDYRVPMQQAYLEADKQSKKPNESRDYLMTKKYYDSAVELYNKNAKAAVKDTEMQKLDYLMEQLRSNGWLQ